MMEKDYKLWLDGTTLFIMLGKELSTTNGSQLTDELSKYRGKGIEKVVFDATALIFLTSSGLRVVFYAYQNLGGQPEIVFVNCVQQIYDVLDHVGIASFIKFEENEEFKKRYRKNNFSNLSKEDFEQAISEREKALERFSANNDVVCYSMKLK